MNDMNTVIERALERMRSAYGALPGDYFHGKDASNYRFNNVTRMSDSAMPLVGGLDALIRDNTASGPVSLYFGVPWCEKICSFCNFAYSTSQAADVHDVYLTRLQREYAMFRLQADSNLQVGSVYFGGGTPTILRPNVLDRYLREVLKATPFTAKHSISCEFSTSTISQEKLDVMLASGVTRVSTGVQTLDDPLRERANLVGSGAEAMAALRLAHGTFSNFNIDLIYGHPYQTNEDWYRTVAAVAALGVPSITLYRLEVKTRTSFKKIYAKNEQAFAAEMEARGHYFIARELLEASGYVESPLGWWIQKAGLVNAPNWQTHLTSWRRATPYFGFGQGAFSLINGTYYDNHGIRSEWEKAIDTDLLPVGEAKRLSPLVQDVNQLMRLIRVAKRIDLAEVVHGSALAAAYSTLNAFFQSQVRIGLFTVEGTHYALTEAGESLVHWMFDDLIRSLDEGDWLSAECVRTAA